MKLNFLKKKKTGWELSSLIGLLEKEQENSHNELLDYCNSNPLCSINSNKNKFIIIRKFASRELDGKIEMLNLSGKKGSKYHPISQYGMTLVSNADSGSSSHNVILPNSLEYKKVELIDDTIIIHNTKGVTITNFKEINCLWTLESLSEKEIEKRFNGLSNFIKNPTKINKISEDTFENVFFGELIMNSELDSFEIKKTFNKQTINFSFVNTTNKQMALNLRKTENLIPQLEKIENLMIKDMLLLKNESWLEENEKYYSLKPFRNEIKIYAINVFEEGLTEIFYKANDLFFGHEILVDLDDENKYESSTLIG